MHKKLAAALTIAIFVIGTLAMINPVNAHFTLGDLTGTFRFHANDFDPHVAGPVGYVWPGSGNNAYSGFPNVATSALGPGYQSPYPGGNPPGAPSNSWYQLESDAYAPFGAVLTDSTGDLIFALNATCSPQNWNDANACRVDTPDEHDNGVVKSEIQTPLDTGKGWDTWMILIPPEFSGSGLTPFDDSQVVSTLTNSYNNIVVFKLSQYDRYAPNWTVVAITVDAAMTSSYNHQLIQFTPPAGYIPGFHGTQEWYYARINGVTAPSTAGRYFFKMLLYSSANRYGVAPTLAGENGFPTFENPDVWVPPQNWPEMLVKGEVDPAIVTGTLRYGGYNATLYGQPIGEAGMVWAKMTGRIDPYTGQSRPDLPTVDAQAFVNATANGHFEVEGLAPGVYDLYVEAAGYPQLICASGITVLKGQSLHFDCYLQPGPVLHGNVFTKHQFGDQPWPIDANGQGQYIKIGLYDGPTVDHYPASSAHLVSWSPLPCVAGGQGKYYGRRDAAYCGDPHNGAAVAFPWHEYSTNDNVFPGTGAAGTAPGLVNGYSRDVSIGNGDPTFDGNLGNPLLASDPQGVGPPQKWFVHGGTTDPFHYEFGVKGEFGAPRDLSGEVPQVYATWINGLTAGRYCVRAWIFRYVQTALDGSTFQEYCFDVTPNEWAGDVTVPLDLRLSSWINKTVYFHNTANTIVTGPVTTGAGFIWGNLLGADGKIYAHNVTNLGYNDLYYSCSYRSRPFGQSVGGSNTFDTYTSPQTGITYTGSGELGAPDSSCPGNSEFLNRAHYNADSLASGRAVFQFWGFNDTWFGVNYGIPSGTYTPNMGVDGYTTLGPEQQVSVTLSGNPTSISDHLFRGPGFNVTINSIDWERPRVSRPWVWGECQTGSDNKDAFAPGQDSGNSRDDPGICLGSEIDVGFYKVTNGTAGGLFDYIGDQPALLPPSLHCFGNELSAIAPFSTDATGQISPNNGCTGLYQGGPDDGAIPCNILVSNQAMDASSCTEMDGGGRNVLAAPVGQGAHAAYFGQSASYALVGGYTSGLFGWLRQRVGLRHQMFDVQFSNWPSHFDEGQYNLRGYTYGYVQDKDFTAYALNGQVADVKINLLIGVNVTLDILFKKESIITPTNGNMSARVRLFDDQGQLVAEWMSSEGAYVDSAFGPTTNGQLGVNGWHVTAANGALKQTDPAVEPEVPQFPFIAQGEQVMGGTGFSGLNPYNYLPGGTSELRVLMAGLPQEPTFAGVFGIVGTYFGDPVFTPGECDFELDCYPGAYGQYPFANTGILGAPDYTGGWTAETDWVNWYANNTGPETCTEDVSHGIGAFFGGSEQCASYFPPVVGLLMGESYHIIPGTTATSVISLTEDAALGPNFVGHTMAPNHLGPYSQQGVWQIANAHLSGEASAIFEVDLNGLVSGNALAFTWSNEFRPLSWGLVHVVAASGASWDFYTYDGYYEAYLTPGTYQFTISSPGYASQSWSVSVSSGQTGTGQNIYLEQNNIPVPEFSGIIIVAFSALAASLYLLRRRRP